MQLCLLQAIDIFVNSYAKMNFQMVETCIGDTELLVFNLERKLGLPMRTLAIIV